MANWCNTYLEFTTKSEPKWIHVEHVGDDAMPLPGEEHFAFGTDISCSKSNGFYTVIMFFQTKWAPPIDFYDHLAKDSSILIYADYTESGNQILGTYDNDGHHEAEWPNTFYSEIIDQEIHLIDPCKTYIDIEKDEYVLFPEYLQEIRNRTCSNPIINKELEEELQACALQLGVNLEDQQWQELIS